jgi:hypothetical protein
VGYYVNVQAKSGCTAQINDLWTRAGHAPELIWTPERIQREIERIHAAPECAHLRYILSIEDWNKAFPIMADGVGQVFIGSVGFDIEADPEETQQLISQVRFILEHRFLFERVTGLEDARSALGMADVEGDFLDAHGKAGYYEQASFETLPRMANSPVYQACLQAGRPDFWAAWVAFCNVPSEQTWERLRSYVVPWTTKYGKSGGLRTVWQACEKAAIERDGKDFGLMGRYRDGVIPTELDVRRAIAKVGD